MRESNLLKLFFVFVILIFSVASLAAAHNDEGDADGDGSSSDDADVIDVDVKTDVKAKTIMRDPAKKPIDAAMTNSGSAKIGCEIDPELQKKFLDLNERFLEANTDGEDLSSLKVELELLNRELLKARQACADTSDGRMYKGDDSDSGRDDAKELPSTAIAVGARCEVSDDLTKSLADLKERYKAAIEAKDFNASKIIREKAAKIEQQIIEQKKKCISENAPGIIRAAIKECKIPEDILEKLEKNRYRIVELKSLNMSLPEGLREEILNLESRIAEYKAKCNALNVTSDVNEKDIKDYYVQRLQDAMENNDSDLRVQELRELRREIDETIKNLIEQKKKLKLSEMEGLVDEVRFEPRKVRVGDSESEDTGVELEIEVDGSSVSVQSTDKDVLLKQEGINFTAGNITVDENGIYVDGVLVKKMPKGLIENNEKLEKYAKHLELKLQKEGDKAVYNAKYAAKRRLFGFIDVNAQNSMKMDAETGEIIQQSKPWWTALSTEGKIDAEADSSAGAAGTVEENSGVEAGIAE